MGVEDRDYARWTATERRRFYSGSASASRGFVALLIVVVLGCAGFVYVRRHEPPAGSRTKIHTRVCVDPLARVCGPALSTSFTR